MQFGKTVNFLDVTFYIDQHNNIQYKSYTKPTDAKRYLRPQSFHPKSVFKSVPFSQMIRILERNSSEETKKTEMEKLKEHFKESGYDMKELERIERRAKQHETPERSHSEENVLTFPIFHFQELSSFKKILQDASEDLNQVIGDTKIVMAVKKNPSIGNSFIQNKSLSTEEKLFENQKCNSPTSKHITTNIGKQYQNSCK